MAQNVKQTSHVVAEIFTEVGEAFTLLGEMEMSLCPKVDPVYSMKASESDLLALKAAVRKFAEDIDKICLRIKDRTLLQIRSSMKRHAYEEAGLPLRKQQLISKSSVPQGKTRSTSSIMSKSSQKSADITLNMLNATEQEVDVESLAATDKLDYDSGDGA